MVSALENSKGLGRKLIGELVIGRSWEDICARTHGKSKDCEHNCYPCGCSSKRLWQKRILIIKWIILHVSGY